MDTNCMSWCHRFEIISNNGSVLESIEHYNLLANLLHSATSPGDYRDTAGKILDNQGSKAERAANMAQPDGKMYCAGLDCSGILGGNSKYLPCQFIQGSLTMEFHLASFAECFSHSNGTNRGEYEISGVEFVAECLQFGQDFNMVFEQQLRTAGVDIAYHTYRAHTQSLIQGNDQTIQISQNSKSVKGCYCVMRDKNKYRSPEYDSLSTYKSCNLHDFQFDLGGRLFPEGRLQVAGGQYSNAYASNLNSFNHFRDHGGGSEIERSTFNAAQTDTLFTMKGGTTGGILANSTKRMYGKVASGVLYADGVTNSAVGAVDIRASFAFGTIFQPDDLDDISSFKMGERYKVTTLKDVVGEADKTTDDATVASDSKYHKNTALDGADGVTVETHQDEYLYVVGYGDVTIPHTEKSAADVMKVAGYFTISGCVHFASKAKTAADGIFVPKGGPRHPIPYQTIIDVDGVAGNQTLSKGVQSYAGGSMVDAKDTNNADQFVVAAGGNDILKANEVIKKDAQFDFSAGDTGRFFWNSCVMDQVPDDSKFYIGMSFETHDEHESMVSGTDLTNTVPLHLNLKFSGTNTVQEKVKTGDIITSFIHYDCILRIEPDGNVVSSA
jgi:hypothetical protein